MLPAVAWHGREVVVVVVLVVVFWACGRANFFANPCLFFLAQCSLHSTIIWTMNLHVHFAYTVFLLLFYYSVTVCTR